MKKCCENCRHSFNTGEVLECRRYPPQAVVTVLKEDTDTNIRGYEIGKSYFAAAINSVSPVVKPDFICGEYLY